MADIANVDWNEVDASNSVTPPDGWPEGMFPSAVNNSARAMMGGLKRWYDRGNSTQTTTGTATAYVLTYAAAQSALYDGFETSFILDQDCGAAPTLNIDALGAKGLRRYDFATKTFVVLGAADFFGGQVLRVRYDLASDKYQIIAASTWSGDFVSLSGNNEFTGTNQFDDEVTLSGAALNEAEALIVCQPTLPIGAADANTLNLSGGSSSTVAISIASPGVITWNAHNLPNGATVVLTTTGALPTGFTAGTPYFVVNAAANTFNLALTSGGAAINTSGSQSGTQTATAGATVTVFDTIQAGTKRTLIATSAITLTYDATKLILPDAATVIMAAGDVAVFESKGSGNWRCIDYFKVATKADQVSATSTVAMVVPAHQQSHPSAPKAWFSINTATGALVASYNVASVASFGGGAASVNLTVPFSSTAFIGLASTNSPGLIGNAYPTSGSVVSVNSYNPAIGSNQDAIVSVVCFGPQ